MNTLIGYALIALGALWLGWVGILIALLAWIVLSVVFGVAHGLYLGMRGVVEYHGGWRGVWRYVRS